MKAWKRIHITKKRAACGVLGLLLLAAAYMGVPRAAEKVFAVADLLRADGEAAGFRQLRCGLGSR